MRKLLSLINLAVLFFVISSCHNIKNSEQNKTNETKAISSESNNGPGATNVKGQTESSGLVGNDKGINKDSANFSGNGNAIIHHAPNQNKIDSIKNAKNKNK